MSKAILEEETETKEIIEKTLTSPKILLPEKKLVKNDTIHSRVVIVCPYSQFNAYFESQIPKIIERGYVDIVNEAENIKPPHINVSKREAEIQKPFWIIDFQKIIGIKPSPKHLLEERAFMLSQIVKYSLNPKDAEKLFGEYLQTEMDPELRIKNILKSIIIEIKQKLSESKLEEKLKAAHEIVLARYPIDDVVPFNLYEIWNRNIGAIYITPTPDFAKDLELKHNYDLDGNFRPSLVPVVGYASQLSEDLEILAGKISGKQTKLLIKK